MSNLEYVQELCGTDAVGWICEQLASELDSRDKRIEELEARLDAVKSILRHADGGLTERQCDELEAALQEQSDE